MIDARTTARARPRYVVQREAREENREIRRLVTFGLLLGWIMFLVAGFVWHAVPSTVDAFWAGVAVFGLMFLVTAVAVPQLLIWPERMWMALANVMGRVVMTLVLSVIYIGWFWPVGVLQRSRRGTHPFHSWADGQNPVAAGWDTLQLNDDEWTASDGKRSTRSLIAQLFGILGFFARRGQWAMMPILVLLLVIGLVLFFVSTSALAPFVYTIF